MEGQRRRLLFQHDGDIALDERHVRGIASLGASTKGLAAIGFMGVGFKSVFARFLRARMAGFGWRFKFDARTAHGDLDSTVPQWFDTLRPLWDEDAADPEDRYTTAFLLERPAEPDRPVAADVDRLASPAVIEYETSQRRQAKAMPDDQPGFDVSSVDPSTGWARAAEQPVDGT